MNLNSDMNKKVVGMLGISGDPMHLYAAELIESLQAKVASLEKSEDRGARILAASVKRNAELVKSEKSSREELELLLEHCEGLHETVHREYCSHDGGSQKCEEPPLTRARKYLSRLE